MKKMLIFPVFLAAVLGLFAVRGFSGGQTPFPHDKHLEAAGDCTACHEGVPEATNLDRSYLPTIETCQGCHDGNELTGWGWAKITPRTPAIRTFSHAQHREGGAECQACHGGLLDPALLADGRGAPGHAVCMECHDGVRQADECEACHADLREGRLHGFRRDPTQLKPMSHHPGFMHSHEFAVRLDGSGCADCHRQEDFCSSCHQGENLDFLVHSRNWEQTHMIAARKNSSDCSSCHRISEDCTECHAARGVAPGDHFPLARWRSAHGGLHAQSARRDISICASCHDEGGAGTESCTGCHRDDGVRGNQARLNIHPAGFRDDVGKGPWHDDPAAACFDCHPKLGAPRTSQFCTYCHEEKND